MNIEVLGYLLAGLAHETYKGYFSNKTRIIREIFDVHSNPNIRNLIMSLTEGEHGRESFRLALKSTTHQTSDEGLDSFLNYYDQLDNISNKSQFETTFSECIREQYCKALSNLLDDNKVSASEFTRRITEMDSIFTTSGFNNPSMFSDVNYADIDTKKVSDDEKKNIYRSAFEEINNLFTHRGYPNGSVAAVCGPPGTGKSLWLMNEVVAFLDDNYQKEVHPEDEDFKPNNVLYLAIGDLRQYSFKSRFSSIVCDIPKTMSGNNLVFYDAVVNETIPALADPERFKILFAAPGMFTMEQLYNFFKTARLKLKDGSEVRYIDHYNVIMFDYDSNIHSESDSLHDKGGEIYSFGDVLSVHDEGKLIYFASQPKQEYWESESIPLGGMAESVRKQHTIDFLITLSNPSQYFDGKQKFNRRGMNAVGYANICKNRDGKRFSSYYFRDVSGRFYFTDEQKFRSLMSPLDTKKEYTYIKIAAENFPGEFELMEQT